MSTKLPAVIDALVSIFTAALPGVTVLDGPAGARVLGNDVATIGLAAEADDTSDLDQGEPVGYRDRLGDVEDRFAVTCAVSSSTGGTLYKPARDRCNEMLTAIRAAIRADVTLGGVVNMASVNVRSLDQGLDDGAYVDITFTVRTHAFI